MVVVRAYVRSNRCSIDAKAVSVGAGNDLLIRRDDAADQGRVLRRRYFAVPSQTAEIVHPLEDDEPSRGSWREDIAIEAGQRIGAKAIGQQVIAADPLVGDSNIARIGRALQTFRQ